MISLLNLFILYFYILLIYLLYFFHLYFLILNIFVVIFYYIFFSFFYDWILRWLFFRFQTRPLTLMNSCFSLSFIFCLSIHLFFFFRLNNFIEQIWITFHHFHSSIPMYHRDSIQCCDLFVEF